MPRYNVVMPDIVAIIAVVAAGVLSYHGTVSDTDFKELVILVLGYVFGTGKGTVLR